MDRSLVVTGKTLEQALSKASVLLHCAPERIGYEIVQPGKPGRNGTPEVPFKLRVSELAPTPSAEDAKKDAEEEEFTPQLPWLANTLAPLPPETFCQALEQAFMDAVREGPTHIELGPPPPAPEDAPLKEVSGEALAAGTTLEHDGHVRVFGDLRRGVTIKATGNVQIVGELGGGVIETRGDVTVSGGVSGTIRTINGNVTCKFVQGGTIDALFGNVTVTESAMHANLHAGFCVKIGDVVLGGVCYGEKRVDANLAGAELGVPTVLVSGLNKRLSDRIEEIRLRAERHAVRLQECDRLRQQLLPVEERGEELPIEDRVRLWKAAIKKGRIQADLQRLAREKSTLLGLVNTQKNSRVCVKDKIHPKVRVVVDDAALEIRKTTQYVTFSKDYDSGQLRTTSYQ
jgi:hypothetical protein